MFLKTQDFQQGMHSLSMCSFTCPNVIHYVLTLMIVPKLPAFCNSSHHIGPRQLTYFDKSAVSFYKEFVEFLDLINSSLHVRFLWGKALDHLLSFFVCDSFVNINWHLQPLHSHCQVTPLQRKESTVNDNLQPTIRINSEPKVRWKTTLIIWSGYFSARSSMLVPPLAQAIITCHARPYLTMSCHTRFGHKYRLHKIPKKSTVTMLTMFSPSLCRGASYSCSEENIEQLPASLVMSAEYIQGRR